MLKFNLHLEQLQLKINSAVKLLHQLFSFQPIEFFQLISKIDEKNNGFLSRADLTSHDLDSIHSYQTFLKLHFPSHVSYSFLESHLEKLRQLFFFQIDVKMESIKVMKEINIKQLTHKILKLEWEMEELSFLIKGCLGNYILNKENIGIEQFHNYIHGQKLAISPPQVFHYLAEGEEQIILPQNGPPKVAEMTDTPPVQIQNLVVLHQRLKERVNNFGNEWLKEKINRTQ